MYAWNIFIQLSESEKNSSLYTVNFPTLWAMTMILLQIHQAFGITFQVKVILWGIRLSSFVSLHRISWVYYTGKIDLLSHLTFILIKKLGHRCNLAWEFQHILFILVIHKRIKPKCPSLRYAIECIKCEIYAFLSDIKWREDIWFTAKRRKRSLGHFLDTPQRWHLRPRGPQSPRIIDHIQTGQGMPLMS